MIAETTAPGAVPTYVHTDALGSPVAKTNSAKAVVERTRYEPYGATVVMTGSTNPKTIGFTGHVNDADTGLVYMQQRYYEPLAGRFLSVDPVVTDANTGSAFGRYHYAENNPYAYTDPTGMAPECSDSCINMRELSDRMSSFATAVDNFMTGGYGGQFGAALSNRDVVGAGINLAAAVAYGAMNVATFGGGGVAVDGVKALATAAKGTERLPIKASVLERWAEKQGWIRTKTATGPIKYADENGVVRATIKGGSSRTPGSATPHVELRNAAGQRIDPSGKLVERRSPGNHTPVDWDLN